MKKSLNPIVRASSPFGFRLFFCLLRRLRPRCGRGLPVLAEWLHLQGCTVFPAGKTSGMEKNKIQGSNKAAALRPSE